jgi:hypothetical protein
MKTKGNKILVTGANGFIEVEIFDFKERWEG